MSTSDLNQWLGKLPPLLWAVVAALGWLGFVFGTPAKRLDQLESDYHAMQSSLTKLGDRVTLQERVNRALAKKACFESPPEMRVYLDLPCGQLLSAQNLSFRSVPGATP